MGKAIITVMIFGAFLLLAGVFFFRLPLENGLHTVGVPRSGLSEKTVLLLRQGDCLVVSQQEADIGRKIAEPDRTQAYFGIAIADGIITGSDREGPYIRQSSDGKIARPGDAIEGVILMWPELKSEIGFLDAVNRYGWPLEDGCGIRMAEIHTINRVQRSPAS